MDAVFWYNLLFSVFMFFVGFGGGYFLGRSQNE